jgi:beta-galactosidase/beta-glucuronidase
VEGDIVNYPRPQLKRSDWHSLDGVWHYNFDEQRSLTDDSWAGEITVPFPPESQKSGVGDTSYHPVIWYQRRFTVPADWQGERILLHFGAVDYRARVWVNGSLVAEHEGGHTPFFADITDVLIKGEQTVTVCAEDDPLDMSKPRGKQEWQPEPHGIWYPRTTGIWQSVWLEPVGAQRVAQIRLTPDAPNFSIDTEVTLTHTPRASLRLELRVSQGEGELVKDSWQLSEQVTRRTVYLPTKGFDELLKLFWSPEHPNLLDVSLQLFDGDTLLDSVTSYTALRTVEARNGQFYLNGRPYFLRLALDQGYWDESLLAAPDAEALKRDVELAKAMGFNGVRKHQKIEDPRYLYWADKLGLLVWEEMPSAYHFNATSLQRLTREWLEVINRDYNHPCIMAWVCYNESWGVPNLPGDPMQQHAVAALYHLTKAHDKSRLVIGNDGWEHVVTDLLTIHDYHRDPEVLAERYGTPEASQITSTEVLEHGRILVLDSADISDEPILLTEFGGIRFHPEAKQGWGYQEVDSPEKLLKLYQAMIQAISNKGLAGFCYTQFADTFQEQNGLLFSDRRPKVPLEALARATGEGGYR